MHPQESLHTLQEDQEEEQAKISGLYGEKQNKDISFSMASFQSKV
jgi:hypothetical protein